MSLENQFENFCRNGNLNAAKELLKENPNIDISDYNEGAFRQACRNGYLEVAKWLLSIKTFAFGKTSK
jgi:ankyrin repeat protein